MFEIFWDYYMPFNHVIQHMYKILKIPKKLTEFGVNESNVKILLNELETLTGAFNQNPVLFTVEDARTIINGMI